jgi:hypothetical protein
MTYASLSPEAPTPSTPAERSTEFVPTQGGAPEGTSAETLLVAAYLLMWAALIGFLWLSWRRQGRIEGRISELEGTLRRVSEKT